MENNAIRMEVIDHTPENDLDEKETYIVTGIACYKDKTWEDGIYGEVNFYSKEDYPGCSPVGFEYELYEKIQIWVDSVLYKTGNNKVEKTDCIFFPYTYGTKYELETPYTVVETKNNNTWIVLDRTCEWAYISRDNILVGPKDCPLITEEGWKDFTEFKIGDKIPTRHLIHKNELYQKFGRKPPIKDGQENERTAVKKSG